MVCFYKRTEFTLYLFTNDVFLQVFLGGLPKGVTETELKDLFSKYGEVTEVRLKSRETKTGIRESAGFGFVRSGH